MSTVIKDVNAPYGLTVAEQNWSRMQVDLASLGYMLRRRYHPGWVASWVGKWWKIPSRCEDSIGNEAHNTLMDAVRTDDGQQVWLKLWSNKGRDAAELPALQYFSDPSRANDPHNHCVPLLDVLELPGWTGFFDRILVEPLLRGCQAPPFVMVAEYLSFVLQALEGLAFMHSHNVSHGDIHPGNIMMDPKLLFPTGFHGAYHLNSKHRRSELWTRRLTRMQVPVKYYYIDFGSSAHFNSYEERQPVTWVAGVFIPPELQEDRSIKFDSFKADIFALGLTFLSAMQFRTALGSLAPLFKDMVEKNPEERPEAQEVLDLFKETLQALPTRYMRERIGYTRDAGVSLGSRLWAWAEYLRVLWHSYRYGLPKELFFEEQQG